MIKLSAIIITFNEERNIARCIDSVKSIADDVLVLDSYSTDHTQTICLEKNVRFIQHAFDGYIEQKNRALGMALFPYVLSLDADESLSPELVQSITAVKNNWKYDGYEMNRLTNYCGKWIRHSGWYPDTKLRLFDRRKGQWGGMNPHDKYQMEPGASTAHLNGDILHYSYYSIEQHKTQAIKFSQLAAKALYDNGKRSSVLKMIYKPIARFLKAYLFQLGFLDGSAGFIIARISAAASFNRYRLLYNMQKQAATVR